MIKKLKPINLKDIPINGNIAYNLKFKFLTIKNDGISTIEDQWNMIAKKTFKKYFFILPSDKSLVASKNIPVETPALI
jgi:hypothetical protein